MSPFSGPQVILIIVFGVRLTQANAEFPFKNPKLSWDTRLNDLVDRLSLDEMILQVSFGGGVCRKPTPAIERLGIKPYNFDTECLHGVMMNPATAFPQSVGLAATFSPDLLYQVAEVIGTEARAIFNNASLHGDYGIMKSISCLAPFINIMRHPLWGRVQEVYGEDPFLSGALAAGYVQGLQGNHSRYVRTNAGCKVVDVHSGPENIAASRFSFNSIVSERDMRLTYLPNFKACIDAGSYNLMCSYNSINGVPACANKWLLTDVLRNEYGFRGYYISDEGAIENIYTRHKYVNSSLEAAVLAFNAGVNLDLTPSCAPYFLLLKEAVHKSLVTYDTVVERVKPLFYTRLRLGEFDPPEMNPYTGIKTSVIQSEAHRELAIKVATKTFVLLKNDEYTLPIKKQVDSLAIVGPMADNLGQLYGNYFSTPVPKYASTPLMGLRSLGLQTRNASGCNNNLCHHYNSSDIQKAVSGTRLVIVCLGTGTEVEAEGKDRADLALPGKQLQLLQDAVRFADGVPVILLLFSAGPVDLSWVQYSPSVPAIVQCFFPAQATGKALLRVLADLGDRPVVSPSGRLPYTWPVSLDQVPPMVNYSMAGRTYRYFEGTPFYPFGYGLSYSNFMYTSADIPSSIFVGQDLQISVSVFNFGPYPADEVIQVYIAWVDCKVLMPQRQLVATKRLNIEVEKDVTVRLVIPAEQFRVWDDQRGFIPHIGMMDLWVGGQQPNQKTVLKSNVIYRRFRITPR